MVYSNITDLNNKSKRKIQSTEHREATGLAELSDSSNDEGNLTRIGDVPLEWYDHFDHIGYDIKGAKVLPKNKISPYDAFLKAKNKEFVIYDEINDRQISLSPEELSVIKKLRHGKNPSAFFDPYPLYDYGNGEKYLTPLRSSNERKNFPSRHELKKIIRMANAIKNGWIVTEEERRKRILEKVRPHPIWDVPEHKETDILKTFLPDKNVVKRFFPYLAPEKEKRPGHEESYNPPIEYLFDEQEKKEWKMMDEDERDLNFIPKKFKSMRLIPRYQPGLMERAQRCLSLFTTPHPSTLNKKRKLKEPKSSRDLIQKINPDDFKPFPAKLGLEFKGHSGRVLSITVSSCGQFMVSGSKDKTIKLWDVESGRCINTLRQETKSVRKVSFGPKFNILTAVLDSDQVSETSEKPEILLESLSSEVLLLGPKASSLPVKKDDPSQAAYLARIFPKGPFDQKFVVEEIVLKVSCPEEQSLLLQSESRILGASWHPRGNHLAVVFDKRPYLLVLKLKNLTSAGETSSEVTSFVQSPLGVKNKKAVLSAVFARKRKLLFVMFRDRVVAFDYRSGLQFKALKCSNSRPTSLAISPSDEHLVAGCSDRSIFFFDFEMSQRPFKFFVYHKKRITDVVFHDKFPLFATCSMDGLLYLFHAQVFDDLVTDPHIVPVNFIRVGEKAVTGNKEYVLASRENGILQCVFHPQQPWIFSCGTNDNNVRLYVD